MIFCLESCETFWYNINYSVRSKLFLRPSFGIRALGIKKQQKSTVLYSSQPYTLLHSEICPNDGGCWIAGGIENFYYCVQQAVPERSLKKKQKKERERENTIYLKLAIQKAKTNVA